MGKFEDWLDRQSIWNILALVGIAILLSGLAASPVLQWSCNHWNGTLSSDSDFHQCIKTFFWQDINRTKSFGYP